MGSVKPFIYAKKTHSKILHVRYWFIKYACQHTIYLPIKYTVHAVTCVNAYSVITCIHKLTQPCI